MLHAVAQLSENYIGDIEWVLCHEVNADSLGPDQSDHLFNFSSNALGASSKSRCASSKNTNFGFSGSPTSGNRSKSSAQHPEQERGVEFRRVDEFVGGKNVDDAASLSVRLHHVVEIESGSPKKLSAPCSSSANNALDGADARRRDVAVLGFELSRVITDMLQHRAQVP